MSLEFLEAKIDTKSKSVNSQIEQQLTQILGG